MSTRFYSRYPTQAARDVVRVMKADDGKKLQRPADVKGTRPRFFITRVSARVTVNICPSIVGHTVVFLRATVFRRDFIVGFVTLEIVNLQNIIHAPVKTYFCR